MNNIQIPALPRMKRMTTLLCFGFILMALLSACGQSTQKADGLAQPSSGSMKPSASSAPPKKGGPPEVMVVKVQKDKILQTVDLSGRLMAYKTAEVRARVEGILEKRLFKEGSEVKSGQSLFQIERESLAATLKAANAALEKARAEAALAQSTYERYQSLSSDAAISAVDLDNAKNRAMQTKADMRQLEAAQTRAQLDFSRTQVLSPINGRISRALVNEGMLVGRGEATHLATIEQVDTMRVDFSQSSSDFLELQKLLRTHKNASKAPVVDLQLLFEDGSLYPYKGQLMVTESAIDSATGSVISRGVFPNPERQLMSGQFVKVRLPVSQRDDAIIVPQTALVSIAGNKMGVFVVGADNKVEARAVELGGESGQNMIINNGLSEGERIIVEGINRARAGIEVKPIDKTATTNTSIKAKP